MMHTRTKIVAMVSGIFFVVALGVYAGSIWFIGMEKAKLHEARLYSATLFEQSRVLSVLESLVYDTEGIRTQLDGYILKDESIIDFLSLIETAARDMGVSMKTNNLTTAPVDDIFEKLLLSVEVEGTLDGTRAFMELLESLPHQTELMQVSLVQGEDEERRPVWTLRTDLEVTKYKRYEATP